MKNFQFKYWHCYYTYKSNYGRLWILFSKHNVWYSLNSIFNALLVFNVKMYRSWIFYFEKSDSFEFFVPKSSFSKKQRKCKTCCFLEVTWLNMWFFACKLFQYQARFKIFNWKSDTLFRCYLKTWHVIKDFVQNLTLCIFFISNIDAL